MPASLEIRNDIAFITMDDGKANAINPPMLAALNACLDEAEARAKAIVLTGRPDRFSAGFDLKLMASMAPDGVRDLVNGGGRLALRLFQFKLPVVAACNGHGIAMGCFMLLSSDIRVGARGPYKLGANETAINMVLPVFAYELLRARISPRHITHAAINGNLYDPDGAVEAGFLDEVQAPEALLARATEIAAGLCAVSGTAFANNKKLIRKPTLEAIAASLKD